VRKDDIDAVVGFINLGLIELYKRFPISTKEYIITIVNGVATYTMPDDFMWIVDAYGELRTSSNLTEVNRLPINEEDNEFSVNTVGWNMVQIPTATGGEHISLIYVAQPVKVTAATLNDQLPLPEQMMEALLNYIGYRGHGSVDGKINTESNTHYQRFEASVARVQLEGMFTPESLSMVNRIRDKGFV